MNRLARRALRRAGRKLASVGDLKPSNGSSRPLELHRWIARAVIAVVAGLIPWTGYLAWSLPRSFHAHNWRLAWVGFDVALIAVLAFTAWAAWSRRQILAPAAVVAATMLICDAWFDVNTSFGTSGEALTIVTAVGGNLPFSLLLIGLARRIMLRSAAVLAEAGGVGARPRHAYEVPIPFAPGWSDDAGAGSGRTRREETTRGQPHLPDTGMVQKETDNELRADGSP